MKGAACGKNNRVALSNSAVYKRWRILPVDLELRVREVKWLQKMCWAESAHGQILGALFGRLRVGGRTVHDAFDEHGRLAVNASPFASKLISILD